MSPAVPTVASERLVFVAGLHRSGTTALARTLARHPAVSGFHGTDAKEDEGQHLQDVYASARAHGGAGRFAFAPDAHLVESSPLATPDNAARLLAAWTPHWDLARHLLLEKSPPNLLMTRFLQALYPASQFVVVVRHPVVVSLSTRRWAGPGASLSRLLGHWLRAHELFWADAAHLRRVHVIAYEDLVGDPVATLDGVRAFLGLDGDIPTDGLDPARSDRYRQEWARLTEGRSPRARLRSAVLHRRFAEPVAGFGYSLDDLEHVVRLPDVAGAGTS